MKANSELLDRQPPANLEAERGVLGSILLLPTVCDDVAMILRPEDFYDDANRTLYAHMRAMNDEGRRIDTTLLVERLKSGGQFESVGGAAYLAEVLQSVPTAANAVYYARIVKDKSTLRALIHSSTEILRDAYDAATEPGEMLSRAEQKIFSILDARTGADVEDVSQVIQNAMLRIEARMDGDRQGGLETGFVDLDTLTGGLHDSELVILASRPSMGKTALALNITEYVAIDQKIPTLFVSLEMASLELADRMLCSRARIDGMKVRNCTLSVDDRRQIVEKAAELSLGTLFIDDTSSRSVTEIAAVARRLKRKHDLKLVVIDYLQLIEPDNLKDQRHEQVGRIARRLKGLARELKIPVLCLAQLNRHAEEARPSLGHLRESGSIEQDADVVMFIHRERIETESRASEHGAGALLIVAKQRNGPIGDIPLTWINDFTRFERGTFRRHDDYEVHAFP